MKTLIFSAVLAFASTAFAQSGTYTVTVNGWPSGTSGALPPQVYPFGGGVFVPNVTTVYPAGTNVWLGKDPVGNLVALYQDSSGRWGVDFHRSRFDRCFAYFTDPGFDPAAGGSMLQRKLEKVPFDPADLRRTMDVEFQRTCMVVKN